jgi:outer membrane biosynthesis protein TonB
MAWTYENDLDNPDVAIEQYERIVETYPLTDFAEVSKKKIKSIKKEQRDLVRKLAKEKKEAEAAEKAAKKKKEQKPADTPEIAGNSGKGKSPQATERGSYEANEKNDKEDSPAPPKPAKPAPEKPKDGPLEAGEVDQLPSLVHAPPPEYREELSEEEDMDPNVSVRMLVGKDGKIQRVIVVEGNELLREAAVDLAFQYRFEPAKHQGKPREVWMEFPITFLKPYSDERGEPQ